MVPHLEISPDTTATRVLVVDDDASVREVLVRLLTSQGYAVTEADGTDAALAILIRDGEVPLIVSDLADSSLRPEAERYAR